MERISVDSVEPRSFGGGVERRGLTRALDANDVAINHYRVPPGDRLAGLHAHLDQAEVFVVVEGEPTFETLADPGGTGRTVDVAAGEAVRFPPGEFQSGVNNSDREAVLYALGAPPHSEDVRVPLTCAECGNDDLQLSFGGDGPDLVCPDCGAETDPACAECGSDRKRIQLADDGETPVDVCLDCGAESAA